MGKAALLKVINNSIQPLWEHFIKCQVICIITILYIVIISGAIILTPTEPLWVSTNEGFIVIFYLNS